MEKAITVLGAGMVGVSCALALQRQGAHVTLLDRSEPGDETSHGNAGVITRSSLIPYNNPALWKSLPRLTLNNTAQLRYNLGYMIRNWLWVGKYLCNARQSQFNKTAPALNSLIGLSSGLHKQWIKEAGVPERLRDNGWLYVYRTEASFAAAAWARRVYEQFDIDFEVLDSASLHLLEPSLSSIFERAVWVKDTMSVDDPRDVVRAYARLFVSRGGNLIRSDIRRISKNINSEWVLQDATGRKRKTPSLVVAMGPWAVDMLLPLGIRVPMAFERGYHMNYAFNNGAILNRPFYDVGGGYVMAPINGGLRLSTGVELTDRNAPISTAQLDMAYLSAQQAFPVGARLDKTPWVGSRPTLPDCRPMIGAAPGHNGLWLAIGHQHVGYNTGPGTGQLLAALMEEAPPPIDPKPFAPDRYL